MDSLRQGLIKKLGKENLERIEKTRVGIAGAGGLGSNCSLCLVRSGFRRLKVVDFDKVSPGNLDRQFYFADQVGEAKVEALKTNLLRVNPELEIESCVIRIEEKNIAGLFADCDIVVECFDSREAKCMLCDKLLEEGKFVVAASGLGGFGSSDQIRVHAFNKNFLVIGDLKSDIKDKPALSPRVSIAAAKQADCVLEYVLKKNSQ